MDVEGISSWDPKAELSSTKVANMIPHIGEMMKIMGLDMTDDSLMDTPKRVAKLIVYEQMSGLNYRNFPKCTTVINKMKYGSNFVLEKNVRINSLCEHHLLKIDGLGAIAYIPREKVLGLSKLNRIADFFSRRPQIQERLTKQIAATIAYVSETPDVAVFIEASHDCVRTRGIEDPCSDTVTCEMLGVFGDLQSAERREFLDICNSMIVANAR
jgi:GTP cyclohydrolase I